MTPIRMVGLESPVEDKLSTGMSETEKENEKSKLCPAEAGKASKKVKKEDNEKKSVSR